MKCPSCGMESVAGANVCGHCGYAFSTGGWNQQQTNPQPQYQQQYQPNQQYYQPPPPQAPYKPPKKMSTGAKIGIVVAVLVVGALLAYAVILPALNSTSNSNLSPSRELPGTWKTTVPTKFSFSTDFAADAGYQMWNVTFKITKTSDPNVMNVQMSFVIASSAIVQGSLAIPEVSPKYLTGSVNSSQMQLRSGTSVIGVFSFTTSTMTGTYDESWNAVYGQQVSTETNAIKLYKQ
jgi:hypothetical protein